VIIYNPLDGDALTSSIPSKPRHCFLMTKLGKPVPVGVERIRAEITSMCAAADFRVIDAQSRLTGRDFLLKIWRSIAAVPLTIGVCHEEIPPRTQANIWYELGVAQALGKETLVVKSPHADIPSDFARTEYLEFNDSFRETLPEFLEGLEEQAGHYELVAEQLERNPILALDYLKRAFLITGDRTLRAKAQQLVAQAGLEFRARNSVEALAATF